MLDPARRNKKTHEPKNMLTCSRAREVVRGDLVRCFLDKNGFSRPLRAW